MLRSRLKERGIRVDVVLLFGSRAHEESSAESDYDIAVVSRDFGKDRFREAVLLQTIAFGTLTNCDFVPVGLLEYLDPQPVSPILFEIKRDGIPLI
jgi:predicted nucleotidyltransferase